ncbi:MAG: hypothetical protein KBS60_08100, partial [Phascolarctobacterium sp.]|nr:hypothetical protein [Candidatus Phascolarctobacterium caballi]
MKKITCELCGNSNFVKQDGMVVCQNCGIKYTIEDAKKMMNDILDDIPNKIPNDISNNILDDISFDVRNENPDNFPNDENSITKLLNLAVCSFDNKNYNKAELYTSKILDIDPANSAGWYVKGLAISKQSDAYEIRLDEIIQCFTRSIDNAHGDNLVKLKELCTAEVCTVSKELIEQICEKCRSYFYIDETELNLLKNSISYVNKYSFPFLQRHNFTIDNLRKSYSDIIEKAAIDAWNDIPNLHEISEQDVVNDYINRHDLIMDMLQLSIELYACDDNKDDNVRRYNKMITATDYIINAAYHKNCQGLTDSQKEEYKNKINEWRNKINEIQGTVPLKKDNDNNSKKDDSKKYNV